MNACPCGSGKTLDECCGQYFETLAAPTALVLMRSRYTAHVLGKAQYLHDTLSTKQRVGFDVAEYEAHHGEITWTGLEIRGSSGGGEEDEDNIMPSYKEQQYARDFPVARARGGAPLRAALSASHASDPSFLGVGEF